MKSHEAKATTKAMVVRGQRHDFWDHLSTIFANTSLDCIDELLKKNITTFMPNAFYYAVKVHDTQFIRTRAHFNFFAANFLTTSLGYGLVTHSNLYPGATVCYTHQTPYLVGFNRDANSHQLIQKAVDMEQEEKQGWPTLSTRGISDAKAKARDLTNLRKKLISRWHQKLLPHKKVKHQSRDNSDYAFYKKHQCLPYAEVLIKPSHVHSSNPVVKASEFSHLLISAAVRGGLSIGNICYTVAMQIECMSEHNIFLPILFYDHTQGSYTPISNDIVNLMYFVFKLGKLKLLTDSALDQYFFDLVDSTNIILLSKLVKANYNLNLKQVCEYLAIDEGDCRPLLDDLNNQLITFLNAKNDRDLLKLLRNNSDILKNKVFDATKEKLLLRYVTDNQPAMIRKIEALNVNLSKVFSKCITQSNTHALTLVTAVKTQLTNNALQGYLIKILILALEKNETDIAIACINLGASTGKAILNLAIDNQNSDVIQRILSTTRFSNAFLIKAMEKAKHVNDDSLESLFMAAINRNFIQALQSYKKTRIAERKIQGRSHHHILGSLIEYDAESKIQAADKLIDIFKHALPEEQFSSSQIGALQDGRLRHIIDRQATIPGSELIVQQIHAAQAKRNTPWKWFLSGFIIAASIASLVISLVGLSIVTALLGVIGTVLAAASIATLGGVLGRVSEICTRENAIIQSDTISPPIAVLKKPAVKSVIQSGLVSANQAAFSAQKMRP